MGLWHGAGWNFIAWGAIHGTFLVIERINNGRIVFWKPFRHIYTILTVLIAWVFFRSENLSYAFEFLGRMFNITNTTSASEYHPLNYFLSNDVLISIILGAVFSIPIIPWVKLLVMRLQIKINHRLSFGLEIAENSLKFILLMGILFLSLITVAIQTYNPFLYFRF